MRNRIYTAILLALISSELQAMKVCTQLQADCALYGERNGPAGFSSTKFLIYAHTKLVASFHAEADWSVLTDGDNYYLVYRNWNVDTLSQYIYTLDNVCENCKPKIVHGRYMIQVDTFLRGQGEAAYLFGVEKPLDRKYYLDDAAVGTAIELPPLDALVGQKEFNQFNSTNIFNMYQFSKGGVFLNNKKLYIPPLKTDSSTYLHLGCVQNCDSIEHLSEMRDSLLQRDGITYELFGDIKKTIPVKMEITKTGNKVSGRYCYLKTCKEYLSLSGIIKDGVLKIEERVKNKVTGTMILTFGGNSVLKGEWVSPAGKKIPMQLVGAEKQINNKRTINFSS